LVEKYALFIENLQIIKGIPKLGGSAKLPISDSQFEFSIGKLKEYVKRLEIDCIAITNHT